MSRKRPGVREGDGVALEALARWRSSLEEGIDVDVERWGEEKYRAGLILQERKLLYDL